MNCQVQSLVCSNPGLGSILLQRPQQPHAQPVGRQAPSSPSLTAGPPVMMNRHYSSLQTSSWTGCRCPPRWHTISWTRQRLRMVLDSGRPWAWSGWRERGKCSILIAAQPWRSFPVRQQWRGCRLVRPDREENGCRRVSLWSVHLEISTPRLAAALRWLEKSGPVRSAKAGGETWQNLVARGPPVCGQLELLQLRDQSIVNRSGCDN